MNTPATPSPILHQPWLGITRAAWIMIALIAIGLGSFGLTKALQEPLPSCADPVTACAPWVVSNEDMQLAEQSQMPVGLMFFAYFLGSSFPKLVFALVGLLIFLRRSEDWVAQILSLMLVLFALEGITNLDAWQPVADILYALSTLLFLLLPFIFPTGRFVPAWVIWPTILISTVAVGVVLAPVLGIRLTESAYSLLILIPYAIWFGLGTYSAVYRYRNVSSLSERQQTKWALVGILGNFILLIPFAIISIYFPPSQPSIGRLAFVFLVHYPLYFVTYLAIPGGIAFAILRYRLWDIDLIIRRTLQYAVLTGFLALIYYGGIVTLQGILDPLTGSANSPVVTVITTLGIAAVFNPLRIRIQNFIDRRFFRKKYNAEQTLETFAITARDEVDMDKLAAALLGVVDETVQPVNTSLWLKPNQKRS